MDDLLDDTVEYANVLIDVAAHQTSAAALGKLCTNIARHYRAMGVYDLLMHADVDGFYYGLIQSGLTRLHYLRRCAEEGLHGDPEQAAGVADPLLDAIAADQLRLAEEIARLAADDWMKGYEYEDDFAYARFIGQLVAEDGPEPMRATLDRFARALEGQYAPRLTVCEALLDRDQDGFDEGFADLVTAHVDRMEAVADPVEDSALAQEYTFEANRWVFVEGLALLRLAERRGLATEAEYDRCPSTARRPPTKPFVPASFPNLPLP